LVYDLKAKKKWCHPRTFFETSEYRYLEVVNIFDNISGKTKIFRLIALKLRPGRSKL